MSGGYLGLLRRERDFRRVYAAQLISLAGDWFAIVPLLTLLPELTGSGVWGGLVLAADTAVFALLSPYAGSVADRHDRRRVMVVADLASAVSILLLFLVRSPGTAWVAVAAISATAAAKAFYGPASSAALPNLVDPDDLSRASVLAGASWGSMLAVGAGLGGLLDAAFGPYFCFGLDAVSFTLSAWLTWRTTRAFSRPREEHHARRSVRADLRETVAYARQDRRVLSLLLCKLGPGLGNAAIALYPLFVTEVFAVGRTGTGLLFSARGIGALVGPFLMRRWVERDERLLWRALGTSMLIFGGAYMLFAVTPWIALALPLVVLAHVGGGANWILSTYGLQTIVPDEIRGRVFSADYMLATLAIAVSQATTSALTEFVDVRPLCLGLGAVVMAYAVAWLLATRNLRRPEE